MLKNTHFSKPKSIPLILKLSVLISLLVIGGISIISVFMLTKQSSLQHDQIKDFSNAMALQLAASATEPLFTDDMLSLQLMISNFVKLPRVAGALVLDSEQAIIAKGGQPEQQASIKALLEPLKQQSVAISTIQDSGIIAVAAPIRYRDAIGGYVYIQLQTNAVVHAYTRAILLILLVVGAVAVFTLFAAYAISRYVSKPINELLDATHRIGSGSFPVEVSDRRNDELGKLLLAINDMGKDLFQKTQVETLLKKFLAKDVVDEVLHQLETVKVGGERVHATVMFADIVGFTSLSEKLSPEQVADFLNEYFSYFSVCARLYFGSIDKFIGDCAMVVFGSPKKDEEHQFHAVACAVLMQRLMRNLNEKRRLKGEVEIQLRIGINSGKMLAGLLGTQQKMEYTVVGDSVNLASRLCGEAAPGQIITTHDVYSSLFAEQKIVAKFYKQLRVRGKEQTVDTYIVEGVRREDQLTMDSLIDDVMNSVSV